MAVGGEVCFALIAEDLSEVLNLADSYTTKSSSTPKPTWPELSTAKCRAKVLELD
jgi:hypothetical protein